MLPVDTKEKSAIMLVDLPKLLYILCAVVISVIPFVHSTPPELLGETLIAPLALLPPKTCSSKLEKIGHLTCCIRVCEVHPLTPIRQTTVNDYYTECYASNFTSRNVSCDDFLTTYHVGRIERELGDQRESPLTKEAKNEVSKIRSKLNIKEHIIKKLKWFVRLFLNWLFHKSFDRVLKMLVSILASSATRDLSFITSLLLTTGQQLLPELIL